ncbi:amidohydrolase family protein [Jannaschia sp. LMIT008]|uniref:metal-dependent hydrolase family protein n=1 Tax=Jannaschia maritima TaxID=3032585 RepID=UPI00281144F8|nr:amidohydrolase family protein [Jannaschia sp. LMIT008]
MTSTLIQNARIVDGSADRAADPQDIAIEDGTFRAVGGDAAFDAEHVIDVDGAVVLPGLIDCHVHVTAVDANLPANVDLPNSLAAYRAMPIMRGMIERGFTTVRDLGGADIGIVRAIEEGLIAGPRLVICGQALSQTGGHCDQRGRYVTQAPDHYVGKFGAMGRIVDGVAEVRKACREEIKAGATFIKVMANGGVSSPTDPIHFLGFAVEELRAAVEEAANAGTYVAGHLYTDEAIVRALDCGVRSIEHANLIRRDTAERVAREGAVVVPTNVTYDLLAREGARFGLPPASVAKIADVLDAGLEALTVLHESGVLMGYGSDLLGGMHPWQSDEFTIRGRYMPAHDVIRSATLDAARLMRMEGRIGTIAPDANADLIVMDGDPLDDLSLLKGQGAHMRAIMKDGAFVKSELG